MSRKAATTEDGFNHLFDCRDVENNLTIGAPGSDTLLKTAEIYKLASQQRYEAAIQAQGDMFQYGPRAGYRPFRYVYSAR